MVRQSSRSLRPDRFFDVVLQPTAGCADVLDWTTARKVEGCSHFADQPFLRLVLPLAQRLPLNFVGIAVGSEREVEYVVVCLVILRPSARLLRVLGCAFE